MDKNTVSNNINLVSKYWKKKILNREKVLGGHQKQNSLPCVTVSANELNYFNSLTNRNPIAQYTVISAIYSFLLKKLINEFDGYVVSDYKDQCNSMLLSFPVNLNTSFKEYLQKVKLEILETLNHSEFNKKIIAEKTGFDDLRFISNYGININSDSKSDFNGVSFKVQINENEDIEIHVSFFKGFENKIVVDYLVQHFKDLLINLEDKIEVNLSQYSILTDIEKQHLLIDFNNSEIQYQN